MKKLLLLFLACSLRAHFDEKLLGPTPKGRVIACGTYNKNDDERKWCLLEEKGQYSLAATIGIEKTKRPLVLVWDVSIKETEDGIEEITLDMQKQKIPADYQYQLILNLKSKQTWEKQALEDPKVVGDVTQSEECRILEAMMQQMREEEREQEKRQARYAITQDK